MRWLVLTLLVISGGIGLYSVRRFKADMPHKLEGVMAAYAASGPEDAALQISLPISGLKMSDLHDMFDDVREGTRKHEATDIMAPRGTPVLAVNDGTIVKLFLSKPGGHTIYQFDPSKEYCYYYAHLDRYADGVAEGQTVHRGEVIAFVGSTGNANPSAPHLHFEIHRLEAEKRWYQGIAINPYPHLVNALKSAK